MESPNLPPLQGRQLASLSISILLVALCGIVYQLIIGAISSYLLGNSVVQFSVTIGLFMFAMGIGSYFSKLFPDHLIDVFITVEVIISIIGGLSSLILFIAFPTFPSLYRGIMYLLIILIGSLVGLEIPILTRILSDRQKDLKDSLAHVLSLDYLGALIGSIVFPLVLLPRLGLMSSSFAIGLINVLTAYINIAIFWKVLRRPKRLLALTLTGTAIMIAGVLGGQILTRFAEKQLYSDQVIYFKQSPYQRVVFTRSPVSSEYRLYLDGHLQFAQKDEHRYHESLALPVMAKPGPRKNVLILGGGDGMAAREVFKFADVERIDLVDIDQTVTDFCRQNPTVKKINAGSLDDLRLHVHHLDAFIYVRETTTLYDRVIIDLPDPHNEMLDKLYTVDFYKMIKAKLAPGGALVTQSSSPFTTRQTFWCIATTLEAAGFETYNYHLGMLSFGVWGFHMACREPFDVDDFKFKVPTQYMTQDVLRASSVFGKDASRIEAPINRLLEPKLYAIYNREATQ